ncbi:MAG: hypothetical protein PHC75_09730, partial [Burkholderiales bacterium]|nr:hypothetical protein [Burkholderiales bacterium]
MNKNLIYVLLASILSTTIIGCNSGGSTNNMIKPNQDTTSLTLMHKGLEKPTIVTKNNINNLLNKLKNNENIGSFIEIDYHQEFQIDSKDLKKLFSLLAEDKSITHLSMFNFQLLDEDIIEIVNHLPKNLTYLDFSGNGINHHIMPHIINKIPKNLTYLDLSGNIIDDKSAIYIAQNMKSLTHLKLNLVVNIFNDIRATDNLIMPQLISNRHLISDEGAKAIAQNLEKLTSLSLSANKISDNGATAIAQNMKNITFLDLRNNEVTDNGAVNIAHNMKKLTFLALGSDINNGARGRTGQIYTQITNTSALAIAQHLTALTTLSLDGVAIDGVGL